MKKLLLLSILISIFSGCSGNSDLKSYLDDAIANSNRAIEKVEEMHRYLARNYTSETRVNAEEMNRSLMPLASEASDYAKKAQIAFDRAIECTKDDDLQGRISTAGGLCHSAEYYLTGIYNESSSVTIYNILESQKGSLKYANNAAKEILSNL